MPPHMGWRNRRNHAAHPQRIRPGDHAIRNKLFIQTQRHARLNLEHRDQHAGRAPPMHLGDHFGPIIKRRRRRDTRRRGNPAHQSLGRQSRHSQSRAQRFHESTAQMRFCSAPRRHFHLIQTPQRSHLLTRPLTHVASRLGAAHG